MDGLAKLLNSFFKNSAWVKIGVFFGCFLLSSNLAFAQAKQAESKKTSLSFEDELVEGATQKPELFYLFQKKNFNYKRLIKLRENFLPEMRKTAEDIQRTRGAN